MGVNKLKILSKIVIGNDTKINNSYMKDIVSKYDNFVLHIKDIGRLEKEFIEKIQIEDGVRYLSTINEIRLISGIEATLNCFYSITELYANLANRLTKNKKKCFPKNFHDFVKNINIDMYENIKKEEFKELEYYEKIREIRTETTHYSTIKVFCGTDNKIELFIDNRRPNNQQGKYKNGKFMKIAEFADILERGKEIINKLCNFLIDEYILKEYEKSFDIESNFEIAIAGEIRKIKLKDYLKTNGINVE